MCFATEGDGREWDREGFGPVEDAWLLDRLDVITEFVFVTQALTPENPVKKRGVESIGVSWKLPEAWAFHPY